jgi:hypothetical protein
VRGAASRSAAAVLRLIGVAVAEEPFFAGLLRTAEGESVGARAGFESQKLADRAARIICTRSRLLRDMNARWDRNTVQLHLAKQLWPITLPLMFRVFAADALARRDGGPAELLVHWPAALPGEALRGLPVSLPVRSAGRVRSPLKAGRAAVFLWLLREWVRGLPPRRRRHQAEREPPEPAVLLLQEDVLSLDRSFRSQPHWLNGRPRGFRILVLRSGRTFDVQLSPEDCRREHIEIVELQDLAAARAELPVVRELGHWVARLLARLLAAPPAEALAAARAVRLAVAARQLAQLTVSRGIRAFLTCENYMLHADAMQLIAPAVDVRTLSYQYSNLPHPSLPMISTAQTLVTFSARFREMFTWAGYPAPAFVEAGYVFSSSFPLVRQRAGDRRARLARAGATFVVGLFDESVQSGKYGWISPAEYERDLLFLLDKVQQDPSLALVIKTQFHKNLGTASPRLRAAMAAASASGRLELPSHGTHRNTVLPAEIGAAADVVIGHAFGGTASLEAALVGCRSIMVSECPLRAAQLDVYERAELVFPSLGAAWVAIDGFRGGDPARQRLGDWSAILPEFDPFRDDRSADRLRAIVAAAVLTREQQPRAVAS